MIILRSPRSCAPLLLSLLLVASAASPTLAQVPGRLVPSDIAQQAAEEAAEEAVEEALDEAVDQMVDSAEEGIIEAVEESIGVLTTGAGAATPEDRFELAIEEELEEQFAEQAEQLAQESAQDAVEAAIEESAEEQIAAQLAEDVEEDVQEGVEQELEETVAATVEESVEGQVEAGVQHEVAHAMEEALERGVEEEVETAVEEAVETGTAVAVESKVEEAAESAAELRVADTVEERLESEIDDILDDLESNLEVDEARIHREQWLVMAEPEVFEELAEQGYLFDTVTELPALGMRLAEVAGPSSFDITEVRRGVIDVVGKDRAEVDLNHIYTAGTESVARAEGISPRAAAAIPEPAPGTAPRIGMIDSGVDTAHPSLRRANIQSRSFVPEAARVPDFHGTAIASIIAANDPGYQGLLPSAQVYAAAVFEQDEERGEIASTVSLLRALDWLISSEVDVVNVSLAGPPNRLLETALKRAAAQDVLVMAAAGNGGPVARPMYPAAYDTVVAVTAVDAGNRVFRLANRGAYLDIAAPGVGLLHARAGGGYAASSGTSFAVPFAATAAASLLSQQPGADVMSLLYERAEDLGPPGRDDIYGYGLLRFSGG